MKIIEPGLGELTTAIGKAIAEYKQSEGENENAFSLSVWREGDKYLAKCRFQEDYNLIVFYGTDAANETVEKIWSLDIEELEDIAMLFIEHQDWIQ